MLPLIAILGPTASGKSSIAIELAQALNTEIISCDSMQIYRGMDIGTATPNIQELQKTKHHLINSLDISEKYDANIFCNMATATIEKLLQKNEIPIIVGGTGMYAKSLLYEMQLLPSDRELYNLLFKKSLRADGYREICTELKALDNESFIRTKNNPRRVLRALEVVKITGKPLKIQEIKNRGTKSKWNIKQYNIISNPETLRKKIKNRTKIMLQNGWIEEVQNLIKKGLLQTPTARQALGYREVADFLEKKTYNSLDELTEKIVIKTGRYAKRQRTWFKNQHKDATIIDPESYTNKQILETILNECNV